MKLVVFGLTVSSSWGNGHATLWRGLIKAMHRRGHEVVFFERDVPYYAAHRDLTSPESGELILYSEWPAVLPVAQRHFSEADVAMVTSYCPDGREACELVLNSPARLRTFYDLDTPVTLARLGQGEDIPYLPAGGFAEFDLVLSYTGGQALDALQERLGAKLVAPLYGSFDPEVHAPAAPQKTFQADISYLGTYAADRQETLKQLFIQPARQLPERRFMIGGAQYPNEFPWSDNIFFVRHLPPSDHPAFYCSSRATLNVTRNSMAKMGYCPSGRLFEAAGCRVAIVSDWWEGLDEFFTPGREILIARNTEEAIAAFELSDAELKEIARAAHERALGTHTAAQRVIDFENAIEMAFSSRSEEPVEA